MRTRNLPQSFMMQRTEFFLRCRALVRSLSLVLLTAAVAPAQNPFKFAYQGLARDGAGNVIANATVSVRVTIHENAPDGPVVYQQTDSPKTNAAGIYNLVVGTNAFLSIDWGSKEFFLQSELDGNGGADSFTDMGTTQLQSVPYAMVSKQWMNGYPVVQKGILGAGPVLPGLQAGANLIWYPRKAAFRAGALDINSTSYWNDASVGNYSFATGLDTKASGEGAISMGKMSFASGINSVTIGSYLFSNAENAVAIGSGSEAAAEGTVALGTGVHATGYKSVAMGSLAIASGAQSTAIGAGTIAKSFGGVALGAYNNQSDPVVASSPLNRIFQVGNGTSDVNRSNALTILRNGNVGIGAGVTNPEHLLDVGGRMRLRHSAGQTAGLWLDSPSYKSNFFVGTIDEGAVGFYSNDAGWFIKMFKNGSVRIQQNMECYGAMDISEDLRVHKDLYLYGKMHEYSDRRLKYHISPLTGSLTKISELGGYHYFWKSQQANRRLQTGVIAQEVEKIFPELVTTDSEGFKSVDYTGLIPHLIEAVKELNEKNAVIHRLEKDMESVKKMVAGLKESGTGAKFDASIGK
ncbi:tail fiber domain-containing protein [Dyadobacter sp. BHUBP1]|uniref:tail fiber domain-containing protein n=1 Tax=Dyadobacter sp. BHUBP1 TaxID=3424178 RepID=UPI003D35684C